MSKATVKVILCAAMVFCIFVGIGQQAQHERMQQYRAEHALTVDQAHELGWAVDYRG